MAYGILTFIGDFPVASQPNWDAIFSSLEMAINAAREQQAHFQIEGTDEHYTVVVDLEKDEDDDVMWIIYKNEEKIGMTAQETAETLAYGECP